MTNPLTPARAARCEALLPRIAALAKQLEAVARTRPGQEVSGPVRSLAEDLLFEAREFRSRGERRGLVAAAPDAAGLAVQLGQALAMLELWRGRNPASGRTHAEGEERLRSQRRDEPDHGEDMDDIRRKLAQRIERHNAGIFEAGRRAAMSEIASSNQDVEGSYPRAGQAR